MSEALLTLESVTKRFTRNPSLGEKIAGLVTGGAKSEVVRAVTDVSLTVDKGEVIGLVGESGCGKSTLGRMIAGIYTPSEGSLRFEGKPVAKPAGRRVDKLTTRIQMVHQDPFASLNPRMRIGDTVAEGPVAHKLVASGEAAAYVESLLSRVGLDAGYRRRFPHQFSGGQRQRVAIARALAMKPDLLVLDEPVASLDVSIQAQVLNLFMDLRRELGLTGIFISHDLGVVRHVSDRVAIMYLGRIVELSPTKDLYADPRHPYTKALFDSVPKLGQGQGVFKPIAGEIPSPLNPPSGCAFHPRCAFAGPRCKAEVPKLKPLSTGRLAACHLEDGGVQ
ncbi:ABC transporter ATP-binding protein [Lacibacterium aquatile]|uniref:ABC transporter ATP-binding protein n=1 Tax=Lacibacterium aquatile TaxID=1168082 RepID=A0ABW5DQK9_9PROT